MSVYAAPSDYEENSSEWDSFCQSFEAEKCNSGCKKGCRTKRIFGISMKPQSGCYLQRNAKNKIGQGKDSIFNEF